jgi:hypothetical protein
MMIDSGNTSPLDAKSVEILPDQDRQTTGGAVTKASYSYRDNP